MKNAAYNGVSEEISVELNERAMEEPGVGPEGAKVSEGKALTGRAGLVDGQEVINDAARV